MIDFIKQIVFIQGILLKLKHDKLPAISRRARQLYKNADCSQKNALLRTITPFFKLTKTFFNLPFKILKAASKCNMPINSVLL